MTVRDLKPSDIPILKAMQGEFPYPDLDQPLEAVRVVVDENDQPLCAAGSRKLVETFFWCGKFQRPHAKMYALRLLHEDLIPLLRRRGYNETIASLPPPVAKRFAKRLMKSFGWYANAWASWSRGF